MSKWYGANPAELRSLAKAMEAEADRLSGWPKQVSRRLDPAVWSGPGADRFRGRWNGEHSAAIRAAVQYLNDSAARLRANADDQEATSADYIGAGAPSGPVGPPVAPPAAEPWRPTTSPNVPTMTGPTEPDRWSEVGEAWQNVGESLPPIWDAWFAPIFSGDSPRLTEAGAAGIRFAGAIAGAWITDLTLGGYNPHIFEEGTPFADNPVPVKAPAAPPKDLSDVLNTVVQGYDIGEGEIVVTTVDSPDGPRVFVSVPGTQTWNPSSSTNAMDAAGNFVTASGSRSTMTNAVEQAIANLDLPPNAQVTLVGHSQGGMSVGDLVSNADFVSKYHVTNAITFGSPIDSDHIDSRVNVLELQHEFDLVPRVDFGDVRVEPMGLAPGNPAPDNAPNHRTVTMPSPGAFYDVPTNHDQHQYAKSVALSGDPALAEYTKDLEQKGFLGGETSGAVSIRVGRK